MKAPIFFPTTALQYQFPGISRQKYHFILSTAPCPMYSYLEYFTEFSMCVFCSCVYLSREENPVCSFYFDHSLFKYKTACDASKVALT